MSIFVCNSCFYRHCFLINS